jgi:hypothetical protein
MPMRSELAKRLVLVAGSLAFAFLIVEAGFRIVGYQQGIDYRLYLKELTNSDRLPRNLFRADPVFKARLVPNTQGLAVTSDFSVVYQINSKGLRDREYAYEKPKDKLRILTLGDSISFGEGVPYGERYADIPEQALDGIEIINASVPGWGLESELVYLAREGLRYDPDWVVVFINFVGVMRTLPWLVKDDRVELPTSSEAYASEAEVKAGQGGSGGTWYLRPDDPLFKERGFLTRHSYALSYLSFRLSLAERRGVFEKQDEARWEGKNPERKPAEGVSDFPKGEQRTVLVLRKFVELAKEHDFRLMVVNISSWASLSFVKDVDPAIVYHDFAPLLVEEAKKAPVTFKYDAHYTPRTHGLLGRELARIFEPLVEEYRTEAARD